MRMSDRHGGILGLQQGVRSQINDNTFCYRKGEKKLKSRDFICFVFVLFSERGNRFCFCFMRRGLSI